MQFDKSILKSKTFWLNVVGVVAALATGLPEEYAVPVMGILNIINRFFTDGTVSLTLPTTIRPQ